MWTRVAWSCTKEAHAECTAPGADMARRSFGGVRQLPSGSWQAHDPGLGAKRASAPTTFAAKRAAIVWLDQLEREHERGTWHDPGLGRQRLVAYAIAWLRTRDIRDSTPDSED